LLIFIEKFNLAYNYGSNASTTKLGYPILETGFSGPETLIPEFMKAAGRL
jgi:hypothetical protein